MNMDFCSIASGSSGNCIFAGTDNTGILIDAGISGKRIEQGLNSIGRKSAEISGILVTHEHSDHIKGLGVIARKHHIPIYATPGTIREIKRSGLGTIDEGLYREIHADEPFDLGDLSIEAFEISHDAVEPVAYRVSDGSRSVAVVTDLGVYTDYTIRHLQGLNAVLLESNHNVSMLQVGRYPYYLKQRILGNRGHPSNETAGQLLCEILNDKLKGIFLGHLSQENNYEELAYQTVCAEVTLGDNPYKSGDFPIKVAHRDRPSDLLTV